MFLKYFKTKSERIELSFKIANRLWPLLKIAALYYRKYILRDVKFIVVIGSLGKTTTKNAIQIALGNHVSNKFISNAFGAVALSVLKTKRTDNYKVIEVGIGMPGQMEFYGKLLTPDIVVITSIGLDHVPNFNGIKHIRDEKSKLLKFVRTGGKLLVNSDDPNVMIMAKQSGLPFIRYGFNKKSKIRCSLYKLNFPYGAKLDILMEGEKYVLKSKLIGEKMAYPLLAALAVVNELEFPVQKLLLKLEKLEPAHGRLQLLKLPNGTKVIGDFYKATIDSVKPALKLLDQISAKRKVIVFGDIGYLNEYKETCFNIGKILASIASDLILVGEMEHAFYDGAIEGGMQHHKITLTNDSWEQAVEKLSDDLNENDVILITGRKPQKLERVFLALKGEKLNCTINFCEMFYTYCKNCSLRN